MHVSTTRRHYVGKDGRERTYETHLLRRSYRDGEKVRNETLANLSHLPAEAIAAIRAVLAGQHLLVAGEGFTLERSRPHGRVAAVHAMARALGLPGLLGEPGRMRDVAFALIVARVVRPGSKLATRRWWTDTTLAADLNVADASRDEVYAARHLSDGSMALFDLSSSWVTGRCCPLAAYGYSRDARHDHPQITYGLLTDAAGRPVAVRVFGGNTGDPTAFTEIPALLRETFGLTDVVIVGDRGMLTTARVDALKAAGGFGWVTALRAPAVARLAADDGPLQLSLFDQQNLAEIAHPDYPGERLVCCRNPALAAERARKRTELLDATEAALAKIAAQVTAGRLVDPVKIGLRVGRAIARHKMAKHFHLDIAPGRLAYTRDTAAIDAEAALDGIYVLRTSVPAQTLHAAGVVRAYKNLANVERDFRSLKTVDLDLRPIHHHTATRVRAHVFLCALAGYLVWHLREALAPLTTTDRLQARGFRDLLDHLGTLTRNTIAVTITDHAQRFEQLSTPTPTQQRAFELLQTPVPIELT